jgi:ABC-type amino acid transport substrate-binding protein
MAFIILFSLLCMALFAIIAFFWGMRKLVGLPKRGSLGRIAEWAEGVRKSEAEVKTATVGDLVLFVTLYVVGVTFVITLYIWLNAGAEDRYKQEGEQLRQNAGNIESQLHAAQQDLDVLRRLKEAPQLIVPAADDQIIGKHVDLRWQHLTHNRATDYVLEFVRIAGPSLPGSTAQNPPPKGEPQFKQLELGVPCIVPATDSADQRSRFPTQGRLAEGTYIWRVAVGAINSGHGGAQHDCPDDDRIRDWSSYEKFTVYPSQLERARVTKEILVGTRFVQNIPFTRVGADGQPTGFDMDLIRVIVERCLLDDPDKGIRYDHSECDKGVSEFLESTTNGAYYASANHFRTTIVPIPPGIDWVEKLQARNIDLYIGSVTRAKEREHGDVSFTSGYLNYDTEALVDKSESCTTIQCLASKRSTIGVVESTTNSWLANELRKDGKLADLRIRSYKSFPDLEGAFERQEVAGVITDGIMASTMGLNEPKTLSELKNNRGWSAYLKDHIGYPQEQFAIAVVSDARQNVQSPDRLLNALNCALADQPVQMLVHTLFHKYSLNTLGTDVTNPTRKKCE